MAAKAASGEWSVSSAAAYGAVWRSETSRSAVVGEDGARGWSRAPSLEELVGNLRLRELTAGLVYEQMMALHAIAPGKVGQSWALLSGALSYALTMDALRANPMVGLKQPARASSDPVALPAEDILGMRQALVAWAAYRSPTGGTHRTQDLADNLDVMVGLGCRPSEALALRWQDVNFETGRVTLCGTLIGKSGVPLHRAPSTKSVKTVSLLAPAWLMAVFARRITDPKAGGAVDAVFPDRNGGWLWPANVGTRWRDALHGTPYEGTARKLMRSTVATAVGNTYGAQALMGQLMHSRESTGARHYRVTAPLGPDVRVALDQFGPADVAGAEPGAVREDVR